MDVRKTNRTIEEFDLEKLKRGIRQTYESTGQVCPEEVLVSITDNLYIYDKMSSQEIRRQVVESLMSINKTAALEYIQKFDAGKDIRKKRDFIQDYIKASNAATGSKFDANANVTRKNIVTLGQELYKENNIKAEPLHYAGQNPVYVWKGPCLPIHKRLGKPCPLQAR